MKRAFLCEWTKLWRLRQLLAVWGVMVGFVCLVVVLFFSSAGATRTPPGPGRAATFLTLTDLAGPAGLHITLRVSSQILAIVALVLVAGSMSGEYSQGTLKMLLSRNPVRLQVLAGKTFALLLFTACGVLVASVLEVAVATLMAGIRGIDTSAWWTLDNLLDMSALVLRITGAGAVWGLLGLMLAVLLRSAPASIGIGIGYTIVVESILGLVLNNVHFPRPDSPPLNDFLPGQALQSFVSAGEVAIGQASSLAPLSLWSSAVLVLGYGVVFAIVAGFVFHHRDVTN